MRELESSDRNSLIIKDARSGDDVELFYRDPTTQEEVEYQAGLFIRKGKKVLLNAFETRLKLGLKILTGFKEAALIDGEWVGGFGFAGKPISSDPDSPNYCAGWKALVGETAADIVTAFAFHIFEGSKVQEDIDISFAGAEEQGEDAVPLAPNSGD